MNIGIDIDDTLADTSGYLIDKALNFSRDVLHKEPIINKHYGFPKCLGWNDEEEKLFCHQILDNEILNIPVMPKAKYYLEKLKGLGYKLILITARDTNHLTDPYKKCEQWLEKNEIPYDKLIVNAKYKGPICEQEQINIFIDDSFHQCRFVSSHFKIKVLMMATANNNIVSKDIIRVNDWEEIYKTITQSFGA